MEFGMGITQMKNFALVNPMMRDCPPGYKKRYLEPAKRCKDQFTIGTGMHCFILSSEYFFGGPVTKFDNDTFLIFLLLKDTLMLRHVEIKL